MIRYCGGETPRVFEITALSTKELLEDFVDLVETYTEDGVSPLYNREPTILGFDIQIVMDGDYFVEHRATVVLSDFNEMVGAL